MRATSVPIGKMLPIAEKTHLPVTFNGYFCTKIWKISYSQQKYNEIMQHHIYYLCAHK